MLVHLLYASRPTRPIMSQMVEDILEQSHRNNPARGITGMLCFTPDVFVQALEGGRDAVNALFTDIIRDERHGEVTILVYEEITKRRFENWSMGQVNLGKLNPALLLRYLEKATLDPYACSGRATMAMLDELVASGAIIGRG